MPLIEQFIDYSCVGWLVQPNLNDRRVPLPPPRFSLAAMLIVVSLLAVLFAAMSYVGSSAMMVLVVFALAIAAHVAGNYLGTQLRDSKANVSDGSTITVDLLTAVPHRREQSLQVATRLASAARLRQRFNLGKSAWAATLAGVLIGGAAGGYVLTIFLRRATVETIALGTFAFAVLGGIWTFLAASFVQVAGATVWQAIRGSERDRQRVPCETVQPAAKQEPNDRLDDQSQAWPANDYSTS